MLVRRQHRLTSVKERAGVYTYRVRTRACSVLEHVKGACLIMQLASLEVFGFDNRSSARLYPRSCAAPPPPFVPDRPIGHIEAAPAARTSCGRARYK